MQNRRNFLKSTTLATGFFALGFNSASAGALTSRFTLSSEDISLNQFILIGTDNSITLFNHRPEMGQGTFASVPMILAEELGVEMNQIMVKQSDADQNRYGSQMVVGSRSIQTEFDKLRKMGASAREMLIMAAAEMWDVSPDTCHAEKGTVVHSSGRKASYGELASLAAKQRPPADPPLKNPSDFSIIGTSVRRQDIPLKTNGKAIFGLDVQVPDMLYASVLRSPVFLGEVEGFNESEVLKEPGVTHVFATSRSVYGNKREGVAVLATTYWAALNARRKLKVRWKNHGLDKVDGQDIRNDYMAALESTGTSLFSRGSVPATNNEIEAVYEAPYQAHVPMEPMNAIVRIEKGTAEFWGSTQNPNGIRSFIAEKYGIPPEKVKINYTFMGGGFGRRSMTDVVEEAADLAYKSGKAVKVVWTREDDLTQGPFRAFSINRLRGTLDSEGRVESLEHRVAAQEIQNQTGDDMEAGRQLMGGINTEYTIPNFSVVGFLQKRHIPISYWRAVYHSTNPFAHECFIDELAHAAGRDPLQFRLDMLDNERFTRVLTEVRKLSDWDNKPIGTGRGVAIAERSGAHFAMVAEVRERNGKVIPTRIVTALDLGICVNPDTVKAQTEGSIIMGLGAVFYGIDIESGGVRQQNFNDYQLIRMDQVPEIVTHILPSDSAPDGAGESGLPTIAPALANAIFDLTGERLRKLPFPERYIP